MPSSCPFHQINHIKEFDALDPDARENPWPYYDWLRDADGRTIYKVPHEENYYMVHRYEDVKNIFADSENFSNKIIPTVKSPFMALMDGEDHARIRNVVSVLFSQRNLSKWEPQILSVVRQATDKLVRNKNSELFLTWANPIPLGTLATLFGLPVDDKAIKKFHNDAIAINRALFVTGGTGPRRSGNPSFAEKLKIAWSITKCVPDLLKLRKLVGAKGMKELGAMIRVENPNMPVPRPNFEHIPAAVKPMIDLMLAFAGNLNDNDKAAKNDSLSIFRESIDKDQVTLIEMVMAGAFILFAGYETTAGLLSNCCVHLARHPETFQMLKKNPERVDDFIEEALRYYTPVGRFLRRAMRDVTIGGITIPKDAIVILMSGAANTDPVKFDNGCAFNIDRNNNRQHLSFGKGAHFCIGAPLARMQVTMALKLLIEEAETLRIDEHKPLKMVTDRDNGILRYEEILVEIG